MNKHDKSVKLYGIIRGTTFLNATFFHHKSDTETGVLNMNPKNS